MNPPSPGAGPMAPGATDPNPTPAPTPTPTPTPAATDFAWTVESTGRPEALTALWGSATNDVWAVGGGVVLRSTGDGHWGAVRDDGDAQYQAVFGADGFVFVGGLRCQSSVCQGGILLRSADGGATWQTQTVGSGVSGFSRSDGTLLVDSGDLYASTDHFATLEPVPLAWPTANGVFAGGGALHAFGGLRSGEIRRSTDGGATWAAVFDGIAGSRGGHVDAMVAGGPALFAIGNACSVPACQGGLLRSDDDGASWRIAKLPLADFVAGLWAASAVEIYVGGAVLLGSRDGGTSFTPLALPATGVWHAIWGASANDVYVAGDGGTVVHGRR